VFATIHIVVMYQEEFCIYQLPLEKKIGLPSGGYIQKKHKIKTQKWIQQERIRV